MKVRPIRIDLNDPADLLVLATTSLSFGWGVLLGLWLGSNYI